MSEQKINSEKVQHIIDEVGEIVVGREKEAAIIRERILSLFPEMGKIKEAPEDASWLVLLFVLLTFLLDKVSTHRLTLDHQKVRQILLKALGDKCDILILDLQKDIPYRKEVLKFLEEDRTNLEKYVRHGIYDCDKFARHLWGRLAMGPLAIEELRPGTKAWARTSFGISWSQIHMYSMLIDQEPKEDAVVVNLVETQNDKLHDPATLRDVKVPCIKKVFAGEEYWIPEWEAFSLTHFGGNPSLEITGAVGTKITNVIDSSIKLKRDFPMPFAKLTAKEKKEGKERIELNPYETVGVMM